MKRRPVERAGVNGVWAAAMYLGKLIFALTCALSIARPRDAYGTDLHRATGRSTCELGISGDFHIPLRDGTDRALVYQDKHRPHVVLLVDRSDPAPKGCKAVLGLLKVPQSRSSEALEFDCRVKGRAKDEVILGLANNHRGHLRWVVARRAWRLDRTANQFREVAGEIVICNTAGFEGYDERRFALV